MKTITISSLFVLSVLVVGMVAMPPATFADHAEVTVTPVDGTSVPGCEETDEGCYTPLTATVDVGGKVIFSNTDVVAHVFAAGTIDDGLSGQFDSSLVLPGASFEWTPTEVGEVPHFCYVHPWMFGTIIVQEAEAAMDDDKMKDDERMDGEHMKDPSVYGMLSDGTVVKIWADAPAEGEMMELFIKFANYGSMMMEDKDEMMDETMMEDKDEMMDETMMEDKDEMMDETMMEDKDEMMDETMMEDKDEMMDETMMEDKDEMMDETMMEDKDEMMDETMMEDKDEMMDETMMEDKDEMMDETMMEDKDEMMDETMMEDKMMDGDKMMSGGVEHVNYDIVVTQNGEIVLNDEGAHTHDGKATHMTAALSSADPVEITVTFNGFGLPDAEEFTGPVGEGVTFTNVIPEFGTIAMMVLAVAIISIVAVTAKSRVVPRL